MMSVPPFPIDTRRAGADRANIASAFRFFRWQAFDLAHALCYHIPIHAMESSPFAVVFASWSAGGAANSSSALFAGESNADEEPQREGIILGQFHDADRRRNGFFHPRRHPRRLGPAVPLHANRLGHHHWPRSGGVRTDYHLLQFLLGHI